MSRGVGGNSLTPRGTGNPVHETKGVGMAKVQMRVHISGTRNGQEWPAPGELIEVPQDEADQLIGHGFAVPIEKATREAKAAPEKATARKPETRKGLTTKDV